MSEDQNMLLLLVNNKGLDISNTHHQRYIFHFIYAPKNMYTQKISNDKEFCIYKMNLTIFFSFLSIFFFYVLIKL